MSMKSGEQILVRDDQGNFTIPGKVIEHKPHGRTVTVQYQYQGQDRTGVFGTYDLARADRMKRV